MQNARIAPSLRLALMSTLLLGTAAAQAVTLTFNVADSNVTEVSGGTVGDSRYRLSNTNWDMAIAPAGNPIVGFAQAGLGNDAALSGNTYAFEARYTAGVGYEFQMFGTFGALVNPIVSWTTADGVRNGKNATDSYNAILLFIRADGVSSMTLSNLALSISGASTSGSLLTPMSVSGVPNTGKQWLVADGDLSGTSWILSGNVNGTGSAFVGDEALKFDVYTKNVIPVPPAVWLFGSALGLLQLTRRRSA